MEKYRVESGSVYEYCTEDMGYYFVGKLNGQELSQFISEYENDYLDDEFVKEYAWDKL